jgi:hypothetical protein
VIAAFESCWKSALFESVDRVVNTNTIGAMRRAYSNKQKEETPNSPRRHAPGTSLHDPEKHALGLDPMGGNRFSEKIMHQRKI